MKMLYLVKLSKSPNTPYSISLYLINKVNYHSMTLKRVAKRAKIVPFSIIVIVPLNKNNNTRLLKIKQ